MSLSKAAFLEGMGRLAGAFGREVDGPVQAMYYQLLSPHMTDAVFADAVARAASTEKFWPSPAVLLEIVGVDDATRAERAFRDMRDAVAKAGGFLHFSHAQYQELDDATKAGIKAVGGLREIATTSDVKWPGLVKRFCKAYTEHLTPTKRIAAPEKPQPAVAQLIRDTGRALALPPGDR